MAWRGSGVRIPLAPQNKTSQPSGCEVFSLSKPPATQSEARHRPNRTHTLHLQIPASQPTPNQPMSQTPAPAWHAAPPHGFTASPACQATHHGTNPHPQSMHGCLPLQPRRGMRPPASANLHTNAPAQIGTQSEARLPCIQFAALSAFAEDFAEAVGDADADGVAEAEGDADWLAEGEADAD